MHAVMLRGIQLPLPAILFAFADAFGQLASSTAPRPLFFVHGLNTFSSDCGQVVPIPCECPLPERFVAAIEHNGTQTGALP